MRVINEYSKIIKKGYKYSRAHFRDVGVYELSHRVKSGLPFIPNKVMNILLLSAMYRAKRGNGYELCHYVWMSNHFHIYAVVYDHYQFMKFYGRLCKILTDYIKKLLGLKQLNMWERKAFVRKIGDLQGGIKRIRYFYCNPAKGNLVNSIEDYPGVSTWKKYTNTVNIENNLNTEIQYIAPVIKARDLKKLNKLTLKDKEANLYIEKVISHIKQSGQLTIKPNAWMKFFGVKKNNIKEINKQIINSVLYGESTLRKWRKKRNIDIIGANKLKLTKIMTKHLPKKRIKRTFIYTLNKKIRLQYIYIVSKMRIVYGKLYQMAKLGHNIIWPPGMFPPIIPPLSCALNTI